MLGDVLECLLSDDSVVPFGVLVSYKDVAECSWVGVCLFGFGKGNEVGGFPLVWFLLCERDLEVKWIVYFGQRVWELLV